MKLTRREQAYKAQYLDRVCHTTLDPKQPGVVRIHMVPPREDAGKETPYLVVLNGQEILPLSFSWAVLLSSFMRRLEPYSGKEIPEEDYRQLIRDTALDTRKVYPLHSLARFTRDLDTMLDTLVRVARGEEPGTAVSPVSIFDYADRMRAPHRMDLMVSAMTDCAGKWQCNQHCVHCYAAGQQLAGSRECTTEEWKRIIDRLREACVAQLTFTGGEPTLRPDLAELIDYSRFFITRLNTNGILLTRELCDSLYKASLDNVQVTLYAADKEIHEQLVGAAHYAETAAGIQNCLEAGLSVSVNTPLCALNRDYVSTIKALSEQGVRYFTCSGLIPTGGAKTDASQKLRLPENELLAVLTEAFAYCAENGLELNFTTPGLLSAEQLRKAGATQIPSCGAALSNMAVAPDGRVIPCQSWLSEGLGSLLTDRFADIWDSPRCKQIREVSAGNEQLCQLQAGKEDRS